jgi:Transposase IS116/IS110/IS902 family
MLLDEPGIGPIVAAQVIVAWSHPGRVRSEAAFARLAGMAPIPPPQDRRPGIGSVAAAIASSTAPCTPSSSIAASMTRPRRPTSRDASPKARPDAMRHGC